MKKGTILKNNHAGYETYFVAMNYPVRTAKCEAPATGGYEITNVNGEWIFRRAEYYLSSLKDRNAFPVVGFVDLEKTMTDAILTSIGMNGDNGEFDKDTDVLNKEVSENV